MPTPEPVVPWQRFVRHKLEAADAYFLSESLRDRSASELAAMRVGLVGCFGLGGAMFLLLTVLCFRTPWPLVAGVFAGGVISLGLPFWLRQSEGIRLLGHVVCAELSLLAAGTIVFSGGRGTGVLPLVPIVPMVAMLTLGGRAVLGWGLVSVGVVGLGFSLAVVDATPLVADFRGLSTAQRYPVALVCIVLTVGVGVLYERISRLSSQRLTESARTEVALREDRYRRLLEHASEGILVLDADGRIQFATPAAERLIGFEPGRSIGRQLGPLTNPDGLRETGPIWHRALDRPGERIRAELKATIRPRDLRKGQPTPHIEISITNCLDDPAVRGIVIHLHDVTDLARTKANYQNLVEESIQGISVFCRGRLVFANQAFVRLFGRSTESLVGLPIEQTLAAVHPEDALAIQRAMLGGAIGTNTNSFEMRVRSREDASWRWIQIRWSDAIWEGRRAHQIAYADVTAQKELEASRRLEHERLEARIAERTLELEESERRLRSQERLAAVGTLAAGVAHQINNPVGAILAAADFAVHSAGDEDHDQVAYSSLQEIRAQAIRCGKIVRSILQFSRTEPTEKWSGDLVGVLRTAVDVTRRFAKDRGATVSLELERGIGGASVLMSPIELEQVFVNLILNAIEAQPTGAQVRVSVRRIDHELEVRVEDDGPGVPDGDRDRIFDPFFTTRLKGGGTGLGLSVAHGIIADHGGRMELVPVAVQDERYACFEVTLPIEKPEAGIPIRPV